MKRREFIKRSSLASGFFLVPGFLKPLENIVAVKKLVVIQLSGGNDWLNTIVPFTNDIYYKSRPKLGLKGSDLVHIDKDLAFNKVIMPLKEFYDSGEMAIVNNVGYPNPDRSHFRSMDIWQSASASNEFLYTGWLGRYLDHQCKYAREAVEFDNYLSLALKGKNLSGLAARDIKRLYKEIKTPYFADIAAAAKDAGFGNENQAYLYKTLINTTSGAEYLFEKNNTVNNAAQYPDTAFGRQLKNMATLISSGAEAKVYYADLTGFDTHASQLNKQNQLLKQYAEGLSAFINNLKEAGQWDDTLIFTFSEFGRRVEENASQGTDHGAAGNVFLFGKNLKKKGVVNEAPNLLNLDDGDLRYSIDFRSIYKDILKNWLQTDASKIIPANVREISMV
jgi:uncharacterized protein (DUF1501 family)